MPRPSRMPLAAAFALACACPAAAIALSHCAEIDDDARRLACYDEASGRAAKAAAAPAVPPATRPSLLGAAWMLDPEPGERDVDVRFYQPNYLLFARYTGRVNNQPFSPVFAAAGVPDQQLDDVEAKFQISFKARLWHTVDRRWAFWLGYTQQAQWQVYNAAISRPFRETDHQPELILAYNPELEWAGFRWRLVTVSLNHQSNGRSDPLSRSWNRIIGGIGVERGDFAVLARAWYRIKESANTDDNRDITDFLGYGDLTALYKWRGHTFKLMARGNLTRGNGAAELTWSSPPVLGPLRLYAQLFTGYGESLIDYNWRQTTIGAGIALNDLL